MVVLDTNVLIEVENWNKDVLSTIEDHVTGETVTITTPTLSEYWYGLLNRPREERDRAEEALQKYNVLNTTVNSSKRYAKLRHAHEQNGNPVPDFDLLIASIVHVNNEVLITTDEHFNSIDCETVLVT